MDNSRRFGFRRISGFVASTLVAAIMVVAAEPVPASADPESLECDKIAWLAEADPPTLGSFVDNRVFVAGADGSDPVEVSSVGADPDPTHNSQPQWSPDGSRITWYGYVDDSSQVFVADADGSDRVEISRVGAEPRPTSGRDPQWSPDGSRITWQGNTWRDNSGGPDQVYVANADGSDRVSITADISGEFPRWSPDGARIAWILKTADYYPGVFNYSVMVARVDGSERVEVSSVGTDPDPIHNGRPQWSPDGSKIAWTGILNRAYRVLVADADGSNRVDISSVGDDPDPVGGGSRQWSPDGSRIAWIGHLGSTNRVFVADADGSDRAEISSVGTGPEPVDSAGPQWSPDGSRITWYGDVDGTNRVFVADADGSDRIEISSVGDDPDPIDNREPQWSPDGSRITWQGTVGGLSQVFVADADGSNRIEISSGIDGMSGAILPMWAPRLAPTSGDVELSSVVSDGVMAGEVVSFGVTVSACGHSSVVVSGLAVPECLSSGSVSVSNGLLDGSVWTLDSLDGSATATISGRVATSGDCSGMATVTGSTPVDSTPSSTGFGAATIEEARCDSSWVPGFDDVGSSSFGATDIACTERLGITTGTSESTFSPAANVNREQMAAFLARTWEALAERCVISPVHGYPDVAAWSFAGASISCIKNLGITTGTGPATFSPAANVNREQMAVFLARTWEALGHTCAASPAHGFSDVARSSFAAASITCIKDLGITTGTSELTFAPAAAVNREQMAVFLARLIRANATR